MTYPYSRQKLLVPIAAALTFSLAACEAEAPNLEVDAEDLSGGELILTPEEEEGVEVNLPETPMTNAPDASSAEGNGKIVPIDQAE